MSQSATAAYLLVLFATAANAQTLGVTSYPLPAPAGTPAAIAAGPDGALWFTADPGGIGRISTAGDITEFTIPQASRAPLGIAAGPDGALWFTAETAIGRITTAGAITTYNLPPGATIPTQITAASDGALWFRMYNSFEIPNPIGRITPAGEITLYFVTNQMGGIAAGPDGAVWFTSGNSIGRITSSGSATYYPIPAAGAAAYGITLGPDGALWFTEGAGKIGRITTSGSITEYPLARSGCNPTFITTGPDGALWFSESNLYQIGRISVAGVISEYPIPSAAGMPLAIATGPDGALWFSGTGSNAISRAAILAVGPKFVSQTPAAVTGASGQLTLQFSHPGGYPQLNVLNVLISSALDGRNACYLAYVAPSSTLYLVDDAGNAGGPFAGGVTLGSAATIRNHQCAVNLLSAVGNGTNLELTLALTFAPDFGGSRIAYASARDLAAGNTGWQPSGIWDVPTLVSGPISISQAAAPVMALPAGVAAQLSVTFTDTYGAADLGIVNILINGAAVDGQSACYLAYSHSGIDTTLNHTLFLVNDRGDAAGPFAGRMLLDGGPAAIENSQCSVSATGSAVQISANSLTLTLNITLKPAFAGPRVVYAAARNQVGGGNTGWKGVALWDVQPLLWSAQ